MREGEREREKKARTNHRETKVIDMRRGPLEGNRPFIYGGGTVLRHHFLPKDALALKAETVAENSAACSGALGEKQVWLSQSKQTYSFVCSSFLGS